MVEQCSESCIRSILSEDVKSADVLKGLDINLHESMLKPGSPRRLRVTVRQSVSGRRDQGSKLGHEGKERPHAAITINCNALSTKLLI